MFEVTTKACLGDDPPELRTWKAGAGEFSTTARFGGIVNQVVTLFKEDKTTIKIPLDRLCAEDQRWIEARCRGK